MSGDDAAVILLYFCIFAALAFAGAKMADWLEEHFPDHPRDRRRW